MFDWLSLGGAPSQQKQDKVLSSAENAAKAHSNENKQAPFHKGFLQTRALFVSNDLRSYIMSSFTI